MRASVFYMAALADFHVLGADPEEGGVEECDTTQVASLVLYLCSDAAAIVNGAAWTADNGATAS